MHSEIQRMLAEIDDGWESREVSMLIDEREFLATAIKATPRRKSKPPPLPRKYPTFIGRYRVVGQLGAGGMANVHLARMDGQYGFQKWVAIKRIHPHLAGDPKVVQMFLDEARIVARISHPNVAQVLELGKQHGTYWIAMEYLHGVSLREVMRCLERTGRAMPAEIACRIIAQAAEGLHAAHELRSEHGAPLELVHRDVTPQNLFVTVDGTTKVVDFGLATFNTHSSPTSVFGAGVLMGTLAYLSPEQIASAGIDRRTDVFALGVVLWELTTGRRLFRQDSEIDTLVKARECNVPLPSTIHRDYPLDLESIVLTALAKSKQARYGSARDLARALQAFLSRRRLFVGNDEVTAYLASIFDPAAPAETSDDEKTILDDPRELSCTRLCALPALDVGKAHPGARRSDLAVVLLSAVMAVVLLSGSHFLLAARARGSPASPRAATASSHAMTTAYAATAPVAVQPDPAPTQTADVAPAAASVAPTIAAAARPRLRERELQGVRRSDLSTSIQREGKQRRVEP